MHVSFYIFKNLILLYLFGGLLKNSQYANRLLDEGDPFQFILDTWNEQHVGDIKIGQTSLLSIAGTYTVNSKGIHPKPSGKSGAGKSDALTSMLNLLGPKVEKLSPAATFL